MWKALFRMRRTLSWLLLVLLSFPLVAPLLRADSGLVFPACCRRDGLHHCAMGPGNTGSQAMGARCPYYPAPTRFTVEPHAAVAGSSLAAIAPAPLHAAPCRAESGYQRPIYHSRFERGPPALLA